MPSPAFLKFEDRMREVDRLLGLCVPDDADPKTKKDNFDRDGSILRGAHVLLCSHLEGFFEDLITDLITAYDHLLKDINQMPDELRAAQVMGAPSKWDQKDPAKRWQTVTAWAAHPLIQLGTTLPPKCLDADIHTSGFANPGTGEIEALFKTVGILKPWEVFAKHESDKVFKNSIDVIVNRRNDIAHGKLDAAIILADACLYAHRARRVAYIFDIIVTDHLDNRLGAACWDALEEELQKFFE